MTQKQDDNRTGFFDLSAEIRNEIYSLALVTAKPIEIGVSGEGRIRMFACLHLPTVTLLAACKLVREEATAILYGANRFDVPSAQILEDFRNRIRCGSMLIRHLRVSSCHGNPQLDSVLGQVATRMRLERLELPYPRLNPAAHRYWSVVRMGNVVAGSLGYVQIQKLKAQGEENFEPLFRLLDFFPRKEPYAKDPEPGDVKNAQQYTEAVRDHLRFRLRREIIMAKQSRSALNKV